MLRRMAERDLSYRVSFWGWRGSAVRRLGFNRFEEAFLWDCWAALGGSLDLVSKVISTLIGVIIKYNYRYLVYNPNY